MKRGITKARKHENAKRGQEEKEGIGSESERLVYDSPGPIPLQTGYFHAGGRSTK